MRRLLHTTRGVRGAAVSARDGGRRRAPPTIAGLLSSSARRLARAGLHYGHGTDNARDEAAALLRHALRLPITLEAARLRAAVSTQGRARLEELLQRRIRERIPAVYLTHRCWFAGLPMYVDARVLIPRSPLAELIERRFAPWIALERVRRVLDLGTGCGCIAIACARAFPRAGVDAADVSRDALDVARINVHRHRLSARVRLRHSSHFGGLRGARYDIIVSNPPYVGEVELQSLPAEYRHEPRVALAAGRDGLDAVRIILRDAAVHLNPGGILVVEVGNSQAALERAFPRLPFVWLSFRRGGGGVFLLAREQLAQAHARRN